MMRSKIYISSSRVLFNFQGTVLAGIFNKSMEPNTLVLYISVHKQWDAWLFTVKDKINEDDKSSLKSLSTLWAHRTVELG